MKLILDKLNSLFSSRNLTVGLVILLFLGISYLSYGLYLRFDLSSEGTLRLTKTSRTVLKSVEEPLTIEAYFSEEVPDAAVQQIKFLRDFLQEYARLSHNVRLRFYNPDKDEDARNRAENLGIQPMQIGALDRKKQEITSLYFSIALHYEGKNEVIHNILETNSPEYELTGRVIKLTHKNQKQVGYLAGHGQFRPDGSNDPFHGFQYLAEQIEILYGPLVEVDTSSEEIPPTIGTLLVIGPSRLSETDRYRLDQFLVRGGHIILAASGMQADLRQLIASAGSPDAATFLKPYGVVLNEDMIYEGENHYIPYEQRVNAFQSMRLPYPVWAVSDDLLSTNGITKGIEAVVFPYSSSLTIENKPEKLKVDILAGSSPQAWSQKGFALIDPRRMPDKPGEGMKRSIYNQSILLQGNFTSAFSKPPEESGSSYPHTTDSENAGALLVISSPYVLTDLGVQLSNGINLGFALSAIDTFNGLEELLALRKKTPPEPKTLTLSEGKQDLITLLNFIFPLGLLSGFGIFHFRKRRKKMHQEIV